MISITSTPFKSKNGIDFKNAHASSSKIVNPSTPITKIYQRPSLRTNGEVANLCLTALRNLQVMR